MLKIGDFSRLSRIPVKTLRYYDEIGLLKPAVVDRYSRYRFYTADQLPTLYRIRELKELGVSLNNIRHLILKQSKWSFLHTILAERRDELCQLITDLQSKLDQVNQLLESLENQETMLHFDVLINQPNHKESTSMNLKIESKGPMMFIGVPYLGQNEHNEIAQIWQIFNTRSSEIINCVPGYDAAYGICYPNQDGLVDYVAGIPVTNLDVIPPGMVGKEVPYQTYAVFEVKGITEIGKTYEYILNEWMPKSGYKPGNGPDFEVYPESFDPRNPNSPESLFYIYFPIQ